MIYYIAKCQNGKKILLYVDNNSVMYSLFKRWSQSDQLVEYIQAIVLLQCIYCIDMHVDYITSLLNDLPDAFSRGQYDHVNMTGFDIMLIYMDLKLTNISM